MTLRSARTAEFMHRTGEYVLNALRSDLAKNGISLARPHATIATSSARQGEVTYGFVWQGQMGQISVSVYILRTDPTYFGAVGVEIETSPCQYFFGQTEEDEWGKITVSLQRKTNEEFDADCEEGELLVPEQVIRELVADSRSLAGDLEFNRLLEEEAQIKLDQLLNERGKRHIPRICRLAEELGLVVRAPA